MAAELVDYVLLHILLLHRQRMGPGRGTHGGTAPQRSADTPDAGTPDAGTQPGTGGVATQLSERTKFGPIRSFVGLGLPGPGGFHLLDDNETLQISPELQDISTSNDGLS